MHYKVVLSGYNLTECNVWRGFVYLWFTEVGGDSDNERHQQMVIRDERRFNAADGNQDGALSMMEFVDFLHPEDAEHMRDIVILETMEDIDKDGDGFISEQEYIGMEVNLFSLFILKYM